MGFYYAIITKASSIKDWIDRLAKNNHQNMRKIRYIKSSNCRRLELWIELDLENNNNKVNSINSSIIQTITRRVDGKESC